MSWSHAGVEVGVEVEVGRLEGPEGGRIMLQIVLAGAEGGGSGSDGHRPPLGLTSPPGWVPYCSGCPVAERTTMSRRCLKSFQESPIQRKTPEEEETQSQIYGILC